jgi:hypothetical protein
MTSTYEQRNHVWVAFGPKPSYYCNQGTPPSGIDNISRFRPFWWENYIV